MENKQACCATQSLLTRTILFSYLIFDVKSLRGFHEDGHTAKVEFTLGNIQIGLYDIAGDAYFLLAMPEHFETELDVELDQFHRRHLDGDIRFGIRRHETIGWIDHHTRTRIRIGDLEREEVIEISFSRTPEQLFT